MTTKDGHIYTYHMRGAIQPLSHTHKHTLGVWHTHTHIHTQREREREKGERVRNPNLHVSYPLVASNL